VVVLAHDRRQYLKGAVASIVGQDLERSEFEIIVVKNFLDPAIDEYLAEVHADSILCTDLRGAVKVAVGFGRCRGRVILVLDDDDLFEPSLLRSITKAFDSHPNLGFYTNRFTYIGADGRPLPARSLRAFGHRSPNREAALMIGFPRVADEMRSLAGRFPDFNVSSSAIRRELVEQSLPYMVRMQSTVDTLFFFSALASKYSILLDNAPLTRYRIHGGNMTLAGAGSPEVRLNRLLGFAKVADRDYRVVRDLVASSPQPFAMRTIDARLLVNQLTLASRDPGSRRRDFVRLLPALIQYRDTYPVRENLPGVLGATLFLFSPSLGRAVYRRQMSIV